MTDITIGIKQMPLYGQKESSFLNRAVLANRETASAWHMTTQLDVLSHGFQHQYRTQYAKNR